MFDQSIPESEVNDYINIVGLCEKFSTLPKAGGLLDQDHMDIAKMLIVISAQSERAEQDAKREKAKANRGK